MAGFGYRNIRPRCEGVGFFPSNKMLKLEKFLINPFDARGISMNELLAFTTDHIQRMTQSNPNGKFDERIAKTILAVGGVETAFSDDETKLGARKARILAKDNFRKAMPIDIGKIYGAVIAEFGAKDPEVLDCFPHGRTIFDSASDDALESELQAMVNGLTKYSTVIGPAVTRAKSLLEAWKLVHDASELASGQKGKAQISSREARAALQLELFKNLLTIALEFPEQPDQLATFMTQSLLEDHPHHADEPPTPPTPAPTPA